MQNRVQRVDAGVASERRPARQHFMEQHAEAEDVAPVIHFPAARLFGRHVRDGAEHHPGIRVRLEHRFAA